MKILFYKMHNWFNRVNPILFITGIYPGSGKSTLSILLANRYNAKLLQIDELYTFLRLDKWYPNIAKGINIEELEYKLYNDVMIKNYYRTNSLIACINFFKTKRLDLYEELCKHKFGEEFYIIGKDYWFNKLWPQWSNYLIDTYKNSTVPVIIEGGQLNSVLVKDYNEDILLNTSLIIIQRNKLMALYYKAFKKISEDYRDISKINKIYKVIQWMISSYKSKHLQDINNRNQIKLKEIIDIIGKNNFKEEDVYNFLNLSIFKNRMKRLL